MLLLMPDSPATPPILLDVAQLTMRFGGLTAVDSVSFHAKDRQITAIIGPNGAGKTTLFNCLTGFYRPTAGSLALNRGGKIIQLAGLPAHKIAQLGIARIGLQLRRLAGFAPMAARGEKSHRQGAYVARPLAPCKGR